MSSWNPPPGNRKMHGDLMYLYIVTVEERHVGVTASTRGFYLNQSVSCSMLSFLFIVVLLKIHPEKCQVQLLFTKMDAKDRSS